MVVVATSRAKPTWVSVGYEPVATAAITSVPPLRHTKSPDQSRCFVSVQDKCVRQQQRFEMLEADHLREQENHQVPV